MPILKRFDPDTATENDFQARHTYLNLCRQERIPDDPPRSLEANIKNAKSWKLLEKVKVEVWNLWEGNDVIAELFMAVPLHDENRHLIQADIEVLAPYRQRGYAKGLLSKTIEMAQQYDRTLILSETISTVPAGQVFAQRLGATKGIETHTNQLVLADVDLVLLKNWTEHAKTTAKDFELGLWTLYPEEEIGAIAKMIEVMNTQPKDDLDIEDWKVEPEDLRQLEAVNKARGVEFWMLYVRHTPSGELAGFTETSWDPENPENLTQGDTGVLPNYRGQGLGKWLKAAMLEKVMVERPVVKRIRTGNADSNAPMLAINHALGFKPYIANTVWQTELEKIKIYLGKK
jgi:mycothiol synthase